MEQSATEASTWNSLSRGEAKVRPQDLYHILPLKHFFSNIVGGVYGKPVFNLLEGHFEVLVVNAQHIKAVPGRKTDVKDAEWIAERYATWPA